MRRRPRPTGRRLERRPHVRGERRGAAPTSRRRAASVSAAPMAAGRRRRRGDAAPRADPRSCDGRETPARRARVEDPARRPRRAPGRRLPEHAAIAAERGRRPLEREQGRSRRRSRHGAAASRPPGPCRCAAGAAPRPGDRPRGRRRRRRLRSSTSSRSRPDDASACSSVTRRPRWSASTATPTHVAAPSGRRRGRSRSRGDLHLPDAHQSPPGSSRSVVPRSTGPPRRRAGDHRAAALHGEDPVDREARVAALPSPSRGHAVPRAPGARSRRASMPSPVVDDTASTGHAGEARPGQQRGRPRRHPRRASASTGSIFVTTATPSRCRARRAAPGARSSGPAARRRPRPPAAPHRSRPPRRACCRSSRSCPGTSTKSSSTPSSSARWA